MSTQHLAPRPAPSRGYAAIVVGGSAGGIDALLELLPALPATLQAAVLVVLHLPRDRRSLLVEIFQPRCALPLREAHDKDAITPGSVSFAPPDYHLLVDGGPQGPHVGLSVDPPLHSKRSFKLRMEFGYNTVGSVSSSTLKNSNQNNHSNMRRKQIKMNIEILNLTSI